MSPDEFCQIADLLPDPLALVSGEGRVLAANREFGQLLNVSPRDVRGRRLDELTAETPEEIRDYLRMASRVRAPAPGRLRLLGPEGPVEWRCEAGLVAPNAEAAERRLMLRLFSPATAAKRFVTLNDQLEQSASEVARRKQIEEELRQEREHLQTTLHSIGDAVIVTDRAGLVTAINPVARQLTGWGDEALGAPLTSVFNIINEYTRAVTENPVEKVFKQGTVVGLANHTILIAKDGRERAIDDSAAPIRDGDGRIVGVVLVFRDVTEQRAAEAELRGSEERLHLALQAGRMGTWEWNVRSGEVHWSPTLEVMHGLEPGTFPGTFEAYQSDIHPEDRESVLGSIQKLLDGDDEHHLEYRIVLPDETVRWLEARGTLFRDEEGRPERLIGVCSDITERKRAEQDLKLQSLVLESMIEGVSVFDEQGVIRFTNAGEDRMFGYEPGELIGRNLTDKNAYSPEENEQYVAQIIETVRRDGFCDQEILKRRKDGSEFLTQSRVTSLEMNGRTYWVAVQEDVTEHKRAEEQLYESELRFRQLAEHIQDVFFVADLEGPRTLYVSPAYEKVWGRSCQSLYDAPRSFLDAVHPDDRPRVEDSLERHRRGETTSTEYRIRRPDGVQRWIRARTFPIRGQSGQVERICGIAEDTTEWRRNEATLRFLAEASEALASLVDLKSTLQKVAQFAVPEFADWCAVDLVGADGAPERVAVAHVDPAKRELAERLTQEYPSDPDSPHGVHEVLRTGKPVMLEHIDPELVRAAARDEGHLRLLEALALRSYMCVPLNGHQGILGVVTFVAAESGRRYTSHDLAVAEDLARRATTAIENAQLYQEVREADRRKDDFLAMLAHELRNPLAPIRSGLDLLRLQKDGENDVIELMQQQVEHLVRLVDDLLDVSRIMRGRVELRREPVQLAEIVRRAVEALRASIEEQGQELAVAVPDEPIWLDADPVRLVQVLENLLGNASKYTDVGGHIWLSAEYGARSAEYKDSESSTPRSAPRTPHSLDSAFVEISVRDDGIGIAPDTLPVVFDLFTQASQALDRSRGGLGIGLTLVRNLVEMHGGRVAAHSDGPGRGSCFVVRLPVGRAADAGAAGEAPGAPAQNLRILVVDDNVGAAQMLSLLLSRLGSHEIEVVHDGVAALAAAGEFLPDLILLDIGLPGKDGYQVARELRAMPPLRDVLLVALTGYGQAEDRRRSREAGFDEHLVKPPALEDIQRLLTHPRLQARSAAPAPMLETAPPAVSPPPMAGNGEPRIALPPAPPAASETIDAHLAGFLRELAHEVGNAVVPIRLLLQMVQRPGDRQASIEQVRELLEEHLPSMVELVEGLRRISRLARGGLAVHPRPVELGAVVGPVVEQLHPLVKRRQLHLEVRLPDEPLMIEADPELLQQALLQLLDNAARYTDSGGRIGLRAEPEGDAVALRVYDDGPGIEPDLLPRVFDLFVRGKTSFDFASGQLGLGLPLARQIAHLHDGSIHVHSPPGQGTEIVLRLPRGEASKPPGERGASAS